MQQRTWASGTEKQTNSIQMTAKSRCETWPFLLKWMEIHWAVCTHLDLYAHGTGLCPCRRKRLLWHLNGWWNSFLFRDAFRKCFWNFVITAPWFVRCESCVQISGGLRMQSVWSGGCQRARWKRVFWEPHMNLSFILQAPCNQTSEKPLVLATDLS